MSRFYQGLGRGGNSQWPETVEHDEGWLMQWLWIMDG